MLLNVLVSVFAGVLTLLLTWAARRQIVSFQSWLTGKLPKLRRYVKPNSKAANITSAAVLLAFAGMTVVTLLSLLPQSSQSMDAPEGSKSEATAGHATAAATQLNTFVPGSKYRQYETTTDDATGALTCLDYSRVSLRVDARYCGQPGGGFVLDPCFVLDLDYIVCPKSTESSDSSSAFVTRNYEVTPSNPDMYLSGSVPISEAQNWGPPWLLELETTDETGKNILCKLDGDEELRGRDEKFWCGPPILTHLVDDFPGETVSIALEGAFAATGRDVSADIWTVDVEDQDSSSLTEVGILRAWY